MSLFVLREGYRVVTTPSGARVVHVRTGGAIDLSPEDVLLFARATAGGVDSSDPDLRNVIRRFVALGVLVPAREPSKSDKPPGVAPAPSPPVPSSAPPPAAGAQVSGAVTAVVPRPPSVAPTGGTAPRPPSVVPASPSASPTVRPLTLPGLAPLTVEAPEIQPVNEISSIKEWTPEDASSGPASGLGPKPDDLVRLFRTDLRINRRPASNLLDVADRQTGKTFPLYDFEISLARMLDGRRLYKDVVESGQRLGIPVNLESLSQFIRQLEKYGFLAPLGTQLSEPPEGPLWAPRQKWDDGLRALFQSGLRMHRQGRYAEAANYFEAMLQQDPQNPEALEMIEQSRQRLGGTLGGNSEALLTPSDSGQVSLEQLFFGREESPPAAPESSSPPIEAPPALPPTRSKTGVWSAEKASPVGKRKIAWIPLGLVVGVLAAASAGGWFVFETSIGAKLPVAKQVTLASPKPGSPTNLDRGSGQIARASLDGGTALAAMQPAAPSPPTGPATQVQHAPAPPAQGSANEVAASAPLDAGISTQGSTATALNEAGPAQESQPTAPAAIAARSDAGTTNPASAAPVEHHLVASIGVATQETPKEWIAATVDRRGRVTMGEVAAPARGVISWQASVQQRVKRGEVIGSLRELTSSRERPLVAPKDGLFIPKVANGTAVTRAEKIAAIVYHEAYLQALVADSRPKPTWSCEVYESASSSTANCKIIQVVRRGSKSFMTATTEPMWFDAAHGAKVRVSPPD